MLRAADGRPVGSRSLPGRARGRHVFDWDGAIGGRRLPDGAYLVQLVGRRGTTTGHAPTAAMTDPTFDVAAWTATIDTLAPTVSAIAASHAAVSPDGDDRQDTVTLKATAGPGAATWALHIRARNGDVVRSFEGTGREIKATWNGRDVKGARAPDGTYQAEVRVDDALGNTAAVTRSLVVDTADPTGSVQAVVPGLVAGATSHAFSPDGDRWQDAVVLRVSAGEPVAGELSRCAIGRAGPSGRASARLGEAPGVTWKGRDRSGRTLKDGTYRVEAKVTDAAGNRSTLTGKVRIDRTAGALRPSPGLFFPQDGDGLARTTKVTFKLRGRAATTLRVVTPQGPSCGPPGRAAPAPPARPPGPGMAATGRERCCRAVGTTSSSWRRPAASPRSSAGTW